MSEHEHTPEFKRAAAELFGELYVSWKRAEEKEASGWGVLVIDMDEPPGKIREFRGPLASPEQALALAGRLDADPDTGLHPRDGGPGWKHVVVPMYPPDEEG